VDPKTGSSPAVEQDVGELLGDAFRIGTLVADEGLAELARQAEGLQDVARDARLIPLRAADRLELLGDLLREPGDVTMSPSASSGAASCSRGACH